MSRYKIAVGDILKKEEADLKEERAKEENYATFDDIVKMVEYMREINSAWVPIIYDSLVIIYRELGGIKSVRISTENYLKTRTLPLRKIFESKRVIYFSEN